MDPAAEKNLLARCRTGDPAAWDELFDAFYPAAGRFIYQAGPSLTAEDVEEICQEVFLAVIRNLAAFEGKSRFETWLFRVAANKTRDFQQRQHAVKRGGGEAPFSLDAENPETGLRLDPPGDGPDPGQAAIDGEKHALLGRALEALGDPCREIIELRYFGDLSYEEIAAALELNPKTVSSRLSKCLDKLEAIARPILAGEEARPFSV